jgi:hypothetical protein
VDEVKMDKIQKLLAGIILIVTPESKKYIELKVQDVEAFSEKAVLIKTDNKNIWFPKKVLAKDGDRVYCARWLAERNGLMPAAAKNTTPSPVDGYIFDILKQIDGKATCPACFDKGGNNALIVVDGKLKCEGVGCEFGVELRKLK